ncbi:DUF2971 domain-containing protein [Castellaniella sp. MT123]|uniref:DUF2971 domain-containing protein n=1 Tax=Castellaniella sp. MT123 TaxID=3140381 RepID=UPI0031F44398
MEALFEFPGLEDPMGVILPNQILAQLTSVLEETAKTARSSGLISMSETYLDYPLWAYYGSNFGGMCLEFDTRDLIVSDLPRDSLMPMQVIYSSNAPASITCERLSSSDPMEIVFSRLSQKRTEWQHEKEWRYLVGRMGRKLYIDTALKRIYLGPRIKPEVKSAIVDAMRRRPVEILEGSVRGYELEFIRIKEGTPWHECERTGAGIFDPGKIFSFNKDLCTIFGKNYKVLEQRCNEISIHPNVESIDGAYLMNSRTGVCVTATYRLRDNRGDISHNHFFDNDMNPITYSLT